MVKNNLVTVSLYLIMMFLHFILSYYYDNKAFQLLIKYYVFLTSLFLIMIFLINVFQYLIPEYLGFAILGLYFIILMVAIVVNSKLNLDKIDGFRIHFTLPILISFILITYNGIKFLKNEKK